MPNYADIISVWLLRVSATLGDGTPFGAVFLSPAASGMRGLMHAARDRAGGLSPRIHRGAQQRKLRDELLEDGGEAFSSACISVQSPWAAGLDDEVDRPVIEMKPPSIGQIARLRSVHRPGPRTLPAGGCSARADAPYSLPLSRMSATERTAESCPPSSRNSSRGTVNSRGATMAGVGT